MVSLQHLILPFQSSLHRRGSSMFTTILISHSHSRRDVYWGAVMACIYWLIWLLQHTWKRICVNSLTAHTVQTTYLWCAMQRNGTFLASKRNQKSEVVRPRFSVTLPSYPPPSLSLCLSLSLSLYSLYSLYMYIKSRWCHEGPFWSKLSSLQK